MGNSLENKVNRCSARRRVTVDITEESIIDFVIISTDIIDDIEELNIDEDKEYALSKIVKYKASTIVKHSDHNVMLTKFKLMLTKEQPNEEEVLNLKDKECKNNAMRKPQIQQNSLKYLIMKVIWRNKQ